MTFRNGSRLRSQSHLMCTSHHYLLSCLQSPFYLYALAVTIAKCDLPPHVNIFFSIHLQVYILKALTLCDGSYRY